jgi:thermitase
VPYRLLLPLLALTLVVVALTHPLPAPAAPSARLAMLPGEVLVRLRPGLALSADGRSAALSLDRRLAGAGAYAAVPLLPGEALYQVRVAASADPAVVAVELAADPAVVYAEPNYTRDLARMPNDEVFALQWNLSTIQAAEAWEITTGAPVLIAVLDTGVDAGHPDLTGKVLPGMNVFTRSADANDDNGHGTAVAGLIAATADNGIGIAGLCWGCQILPVKVLSARGSGSDAGVAFGMRWAVDQGARVINMSLGGGEDSHTLREAVQYALDRGVVIVAASGNERQEGNLPNYPAAYPEVLAVGATGPDDVLTGFSNTGDYLDLTAPGVGLWTTLPGGRYGTPNGTSFASPHIAGAAGLVLSLRSDLGWYDVGCILRTTSDDRGAPGPDPEYGWGRLNLLRAVQLAGSYQGCPQDPPAPAPQPTTEPLPAPEPLPVPEPPVAVPPAAAPPPFAPVPPPPPDAGLRYFPETGHTLRGAFLRYWAAQGGLSIFGFPTSEEYLASGPDGRTYTVQYFERHRFELRPDQPPPYDVQLSRIGDDVLRAGGRDWFTFPRGGALAGCLYFAETDQSLCEPFLSYWASSGIEFDGRPGKSYAESLALFGLPISPPQSEEVAPGVIRTVQWFERARFEEHEGGRVLLGLLGNEEARLRGWR